MAVDGNDNPEEEIDQKFKELKERYQNSPTHPDFTVEDERSLAFKRVKQVLARLVEKASEITPQYADVATRQLRSDIDRLHRFQEAVDKGDIDPRGNVLAAPPFSKVYQDDNLTLFYLDAIKYDPTQQKLAQALIQNIGVRLPEDETLISLVKKADDEHNRTHGIDGDIRLANDSSNWTFPTDITGVAINVGHSYLGGGINVTLAFTPQILQPQGISKAN